MYLFVGVFTGIVLVLIVRRMLKVLSHGENSARVECGRTPLSVLAFVVKLSIGVGYGMIRVNRQCPFERQRVAIPPGEVPATSSQDLRGFCRLEAIGPAHAGAMR